MRQELLLSTTGLGIVFYSPFAVAGINAGDDYFSTCFQDPAQVGEHAMRGDIVAFCTGSGGNFRLKVHDGELDDDGMQASEFKIRLCLEVRDGEVCVRDLYDLMEWSPECPPSQTVKFADGFYRVTVYSSTPVSGIIGDNQTIHLHFEKVDQRPILKWAGVPQLC